MKWINARCQASIFSAEVIEVLANRKQPAQCSFSLIVQGTIMLGFWLLMVAAALSLLGAFFHGVVGGRMYMDNINRTDLEPLGKSLSLVSWHVFTIFLFVGAVSFLLAGFGLLSSIALYPVIVINILGALLFIFLGFNGHKELMKMPGAFLMATTALSGYLGATWLA